VSFAYGPHAEPVLRGLDLDVLDGDHLAVVGPSGIGKSTLAGLIAGLLRPTAGEVRLAGVPLADIPAAGLPACRVLIPQEAYVFAGTLGENLRYLAPAAPAAQPGGTSTDPQGRRPRRTPLTTTARPTGTHRGPGSDRSPCRTAAHRAQHPHPGKHQQ